MNIKNTFFLTLICLSALGNLNAQVQKVGFGLKYNADTKLFDCYLKVDKGQALLTRHRIQFNAQISIIVPTGSTLSLTQNYMPLVDNINYKSTKPSKWTISNSIKRPELLSNSDVFSIVPSLTPTAFYNDLNEGDEVKLFSVNISPLPKCAEGVRLFDNEKDPISSDRGMQGGDFRNGFTIGSAEQKYANNFTLENALLPSGELVEPKEVFENDNVTLNAGQWINAVSFEWTGPNGFKSNERNPMLKNVSQNNAGKYNLTVASDLGCTVSKTTTLNVQAIENLTKEVSSNSNAVYLNSKNEVVSISSRVYPNPASDFINLSIDAQKGTPVSASIYNNEGKMVMKNVVNQKMDGNQLEKTIPLKLTSGVYTVKVTVNGQDTDLRFICIE